MRTTLPAAVGLVQEQEEGRSSRLLALISRGILVGGEFGNFTGAAEQRNCGIVSGNAPSTVRSNKTQEDSLTRFDDVVAR